MILILIAIPADANLLNGYALNGSVLVGYVLNGYVLVGHVLVGYFCDSCWCTPFEWIRIEWIRIAWIRLGGIRVERIRIGGIRIGGIRFEWICVQNLLMQTFEWIRSGGIRVERIRLGGIRLEWICVGYVWCAGYVRDMCGVRYANNLLKNPATKRLSGKTNSNKLILRERVRERQEVIRRVRRGTFDQRKGSTDDRVYYCMNHSISWDFLWNTDYKDQMPESWRAQAIRSKWDRVERTDKKERAKESEP